MHLKGHITLLFAKGHLKNQVKSIKPNLHLGNRSNQAFILLISINLEKYDVHFFHSNSDVSLFVV